MILMFAERPNGAAPPAGSGPAIGLDRCSADPPSDLVELLLRTAHLFSQRLAVSDCMTCWSLLLRSHRPVLRPYPLRKQQRLLCVGHPQCRISPSGVSVRRPAACADAAPQRLAAALALAYCPYGRHTLCAARLAPTGYPDL